MTTCPACGDERGPTAVFCPRCTLARHRSRFIDYRAAINVPAFSFESDERLDSKFDAEIADGVVIDPFTVVQRGVDRPTRIAKGCRIDSGCHIGHDVELGEGVTVTAHAVLAGFVVVGANAYLGVGCVVRQRLKIGKDSLVGAGAVVVRDVPENVVVVGNPARVLGKRFK